MPNNPKNNQINIINHHLLNQTDMKKVNYLFLAAAALTLAACNNNEDEMSGPVAAHITAGIGAPQTRAVGSSWNADHIGVSVTAAPNSEMETLYRNVEYSTAATGTVAAEFTAVSGGIFFQDATETVTFSAYAPYQSALTGNTIDVDTQTNNGDSQEDIDFLFAAGATASRSNPTVIFTDNSTSGGTDCSFHHMMAQLNIVFQTSTTDGFAASDILDADNTFNLGGLTHEGMFDVTDGGTAVTGTAVASWDITACKHTDANNRRTYSLILLPQDLTATALNVSVVIGGQTYSNTADVKPNLEAGYSYTYTITVKKTGLAVSGCTISNWVDGTGGSGDAVMPQS